MQEFTVELDDTTAAWLEAAAAERKQSPSQFVEALLRELQRSPPTERDVG